LAASQSLVEIFLAGAPAGATVPGDHGELQRLLARAYETARAPWPGIALDAARLIRHLAKRLPAASREQPLDRVLEALHLSDLYLACACAEGAPGAADALERDYLSRVPGVLRHHRHTPESIDDISQKLREKLVLKAHISTYTGEGELWSWIKVIAKRTANRETRSDASEPSGLSGLIEQAPASGDLEKDVLKKDLLAELQAALNAAGATLSPEQRDLLMYHYRNKLPEAEIARIYGTSQPTISRRLKGIRETILAQTKRLLRERLDLAESDFDSLIADVQSRWLDLTLSQLLGASKKSEPSSR